MMNLENIKRDLEQHIGRYEAQNEALRKASVKTKKDGTEYKDLARAVVNCCVGKNSYVENADHPYLTVYYSYNNYCDGIHIPAFVYLDELPETDERRKKYVRQFVRQTAILSAAECNAAIGKLIEQNEQKIISLKDQMERAETAYKAFMESFIKLKHELWQNCGSDNKNNTLSYDIMENITKY